jgi:hypothetical protein
VNSESIVFDRDWSLKPRLISREVFGEQACNLTYYPTPYDRNPVSFWEMDQANWLFVVREYVKIFWFRLYSPLTSMSLKKTSFREQTFRGGRQALSRSEEHAISCGA